MRKIIFFNHYHNGDVFITKEFVRQIMNELPLLEYEYWHGNNPKIIRDLTVPTESRINEVSSQFQFYSSNDKETLSINTYLGAYPDICQQYKGCNMFSLRDSWGRIFNEVNRFAGSKLELKSDFDFYVPRIAFQGFFRLESVQAFIEKTKGKTRILICNNEPRSGQSFVGNMQLFINNAAHQNKDIVFICTKKFYSPLTNVYFTDDIIEADPIPTPNALWNDTPRATCDLNEISYLSTYCGGIIGRNSGPFVFCETSANYNDPKKHFLTFNRTYEESLANSVFKRCHYTVATDFSSRAVTLNINNLIRAIK